MMIDFVKKGLEFYGKLDNLRKRVKVQFPPPGPTPPIWKGGGGSKFWLPPPKGGGNLKN